MPVIWFRDVHNRPIRLIEARQEHFETAHPEMVGQREKIHETLLNPDRIVRSQTDPDAELFYCRYDATPVSQKYLCVVVKVVDEDLFIITAYFTDTIKRGKTLWGKR
jgi:hypothetical protein